MKWLILRDHTANKDCIWGNVFQFKAGEQQKIPSTKAEVVAFVDTLRLVLTAEFAVFTDDKNVDDPILMTGICEEITPSNISHLDEILKVVSDYVPSNYIYYRNSVYEKWVAYESVSKNEKVSDSPESQACRQTA